MKKSLSERVSQHQHKKQQGKRRTAKVEFIALKEDIREALDAGWSMKAVWETLSSEGQISFGYKAFRNYVITLIKSEQEHTKEGEKKEEEAKNEIRGFTFNPKPNLEELV